MQNSIELVCSSSRRLVEHRHFVPFCVVAGAVLRLLWISTGNTHLTMDSAWYDWLAVSLAAGHGYYLNGHPFAYFPIGYPAFLAALDSLFGHSLFVAKLANVVLSLATVLLTYFVSKRIFRSEFAARVAV